MSVGMLFVDDEPDVEALVRQSFRADVKAGRFHLHFAADGAEALKTLAEHPDIRLVFTDINMPGMDGLTLLTKIVDLPETPTTVVVSAYGDLKNIRTAMNTGAFDFLTKPLDFEDFRATLDKAAAHVKRLEVLEHEKSEALRTKAMLSRHFSPSVVDYLAGGPNAISGSGDRRDASFLFSDIQGFLGLLENLEPEQVVALLNEYLENVVNIVFDHSGTVMKIIGDSVHATFGAPTENPRHAEAAVDTAVEIDRFARSFGTRKQAEGVAIGKTRIGVHSGEAVFGNFGSSRYFDYSAYGDAVNIASRLEQANKVLGTNICVSADTVGRIGNFRGRPIGELILRGKTDPIQAYEPMPHDLAGDDDIARYNAAYEMIRQKDPGARAAFAGLVSGVQQDPMASFHLSRILDGILDLKIKV